MGLFRFAEPMCVEVLYGLFGVRVKRESCRNVAFLKEGITGHVGAKKGLFSGHYGYLTGDDLTVFHEGYSYGLIRGKTHNRHTSRGLKDHRCVITGICLFTDIPDRCGTCPQEKTESEE
jgi:hypothetical protein